MSKEDNPKPAPVPAESFADPNRTEGPTMQFESTYGEMTQLTGRYQIDPIPGGKRFQGCWLVLDSDERYILSYRPNPDRLEFAYKRVVVTGRRYTPGRDTQHILANHFEVHSMALAPGEEPYPAKPTEIPTPPTVSNAADFQGKHGRWIRILATLESFEPGPEPIFGFASLKLADGTRMRSQEVSTSRWQALVGQVVSVIALLERQENGSFSFGGMHAICQGDLDRCGMEKPPKRQKGQP